MTTSKLYVYTVIKIEIQELKMDPDRKMFTTRLDREIIKQLKILAAHQETSINHLLEEGVQDLLKKYEKKQHK